MEFKMLSKEVAKGLYASGGPECSYGNCPSVFAMSDGKVAIVGDRMSPELLAELEATGLVKVYDHEVAIVVDAELLRLAMPGLPDRSEIADLKEMEEKASQDNTVH